MVSDKIKQIARNEEMIFNKREKARDDEIAFIKHDGKTYANRGMFSSEGKHKYFFSLVRDAKGYGEIYCKYCHKDMKPILVANWQIACSKCSYGLTPDFFTEDELKYWIEFGTELDLEKIGNEDLKTRHEESMKSWKENKDERESNVDKGDGVIFVYF